MVQRSSHGTRPLLEEYWYDAPEKARLAKRALSREKVIPVRNAWHMLLYAWDLLAWRGRWDAAAEQSPGMLGLLARVWSTTRPLLRRELARSFVEQRETVSGVEEKSTSQRA